MYHISAFLDTPNKLKEVKEEMRVELERVRAEVLERVRAEVQASKRSGSTYTGVYTTIGDIHDNLEQMKLSVTNTENLTEDINWKSATVLPCVEDKEFPRIIQFSHFGLNGFLRLANVVIALWNLLVPIPFLHWEISNLISS